MLDERQRRALLRAMDIEIYVLRGAARGAGDVAARATDAASAAAEPAPAHDLALVVACASAPDRDAATARLRDLLPRALGLPAERIRWIGGAGMALPEPPAARAYLALGAEMPRALGANLSTMQQMSALIAAADEPAASLRDGLAKRALWQALKPLARQLNARLH